MDPNIPSPSDRDTNVADSNLTGPHLENSFATRHQTDPAAAVNPPHEVDLLAGRYRLGEPLGEGGMGSVYRAEQVYPVRRPVAIKLIRAGMDSARVIQRFDAERQALAVMDHPGIAKVLDAGTTPDGRPFFAMELVEGQTLTEYCDAQRLTVASRLTLFVQVCKAVQHAHQKGIIHRDLKPGNILVTELDGKPIPKVIDFGLAKALESGVLPDLSLEGSILGTPIYMAPEQADPATADIDTRADVYALGVILYELLTGSTPLTRDTIRRLAMAEVLRQVREVDPPTPVKRLDDAGALPNIAAVRQIDPGMLKKIVRGDLEWVTMKCLEKDRNRRYETANAVADEVLRHLADEPVTAGRPSRWYKTRKFIRRNRGPVIAAGLFLAALLAGMIGTSIGLVEAYRQRIAAENARKAESDRAEGEAAAKTIAIDQTRRAEKRLELLRAAVSTFVNELPIVGENALYADDVRRELLNLSGRIVAELRGNEDLGRVAEDGSTAILLRESEKAVANRDYPTARQKLMQAHDAFDQALRSESPVSDKTRNNLATIFTDLGKVDIAERKFGEAEKHFLHAIALRKDILGSPVGDLDAAYVGIRLTDSILARGELDAKRGRWPAACSSYRDAVDRLESLTKESLSSGMRERARLSLVKAYGELAEAEFNSGLSDRGAQTYEQAIRLIQEYRKAAPLSVNLRLSFTRYASLFGDRLLLVLKDYRRAGTYYTLALDELNAHVRSESLASLEKLIGLQYYRVGLAAEKSGDADASHAAYLQCLKYRDRLVRDLEDRKEPSNSMTMINAKIDRMLAYGRCRMPAEALRTATGLLKLAELDTMPPPEQRRFAYFSAIGFGLCSTAFPPGSAEREDYQSKAMIALRKAPGWNLSDPDLDPLRDRADFQKLRNDRFPIIPTRRELAPPPRPVDM